MCETDRILVRRGGGGNKREDDEKRGKIKGDGVGEKERSRS